MRLLLMLIGAGFISLGILIFGGYVTAKAGPTFYVALGAAAYARAACEPAK